MVKREGHGVSDRHLILYLEGKEHLIIQRVSSWPTYPIGREYCIRVEV